jgi:O-methyltransferase
MPLAASLKRMAALLASGLASRWFMVPYYTAERRRAIVESGDPVRYGTVDLSLERLERDRVPGSIAECGVYRGALSRFIHGRAPERRLYLFDTFRGFDPRDSQAAGDERFRDTSRERVLAQLKDTRNVVVREGYFPETASGLEDERFAFVMIDFDKYEPTLAALEFFYPRTSRGGFVFVHDYSSPESNWACSRALDGFLADKPERPILIPDGWGSALFRKS